MAVSVKRFREQGELVNAAKQPKRFRRQTHVPTLELIDPYSYDKNLARLICFFQNIDQIKIEEVLTSCDNNLEMATSMLNNLALDQEPREQFYADSLCQQFQNVQSIEEANQVAQGFFREYANEIQRQQRVQQEQMAFLLQKLKQDTDVLKKGVRLLAPKAELGEKVEAIQQENNMLKQEIQKLKLDNYCLRMQLNNQEFSNEGPPAIF